MHVMYTFSEILKFQIFKTKKIALNGLNEEKYRQYENERFETFERVIILLLYTSYTG